MANDVYTTVRDGHECDQSKPSEKRQRPLKLFLPNDALEFVAMDIPVPLPKTLSGHQFVLKMTDCYAKVTRYVGTLKTTALDIVSLSLDTGKFQMESPNSF